jgi:hypothetical protein
MTVATNKLNGRESTKNWDFPGKIRQIPLRDDEEARNKTIF